MTQMVGGFLKPADQPAALAESDAPFALIIRIALRPDTFAQVEADLRDFVALRNWLAHHFLDDHDLGSEPSCLGAKVALEDALARISASYAVLREWAGNMDRVRAAMAAQMASPAIQDHFATGCIPWAHTQIAQALQAAALELGAGNWTPVDAAIAWVNARYPEEMPGGYGCTTWRQVIHKSKLFDLKRQQDGLRRIAHYRPRVAKNPQP